MGKKAADAIKAIREGQRNVEILCTHAGSSYGARYCGRANTCLEAFNDLKDQMENAGDEVPDPGACDYYKATPIGVRVEQSLDIQPV